MTIVTDRGDGRSERAAAFREKLLGSGIPCAALGYDDALAMRNEKCVVAFHDETARVMDVIDSSEALLCDGDALMSSDISASDREFARVADRVAEALELRFSVRYGMHYGNLYAEDGDTSFFLGERIRFTLTEKLIIRHLVFSPNRFFTEREIALFTLLNTESRASRSPVGTHVSNINRKAVLCTSFPLIVTKRGKGYCFDDPTIA